MEEFDEVITDIKDVPEETYDEMSDNEGGDSVE